MQTINERVKDALAAPGSHLLKAYMPFLREICLDLQWGSSGGSAVQVTKVAGCFTEHAGTRNRRSYAVCFWALCSF